MPANTESILTECFRTWRKNQVLALPYFFSSIVSVFLLVSYIAAVYFLLNPFKAPLSSLSLSSVDWVLLMLDILLLFPLLFVIFAASVFFSAGAIGMAGAALKTGKTSVDDMFESGRKRFVSLFLAKIILFIATVILSVILLMMQMILNGQWVEAGTVIFSVMFVGLDYAVVIGGLGPVAGLKKAYGFFSDNKFEVVLMWAFVRAFELLLVLSYCMIALIVLGLFSLLLPLDGFSAGSLMAAADQSLWIIVSAAAVLFIAYSLFSIYLLLPLTALFWSKLYLERASRT